MAEIYVRALRQKDGSLLVHFPIREYTTEYTKINGKIQPISKVSTFSGDITGIDIITTENLLVGYRHYMNTDLVLPVLEYQEKEKELLVNKIFDSVNEVYLWKSIDDEFEYKKFQATWNSRVYKTVEQVTGRYVFEIEDMVYSDIPYIVPMRHYGEKITENIFKFDGLNAAFDYIHEIAKELGYVYMDEINKRGEAKNEMEYSYPSHSGLTYLKISGHYVYGSSNPTTFKTIIGTYEECKKEFDRQYNNLKTQFLLDLNKRKTIDKLSASSILSNVKWIRSHVVQIDSKVSTVKEQRLAEKSCMELIDKLEAYISGKQIEF